MHKHDFLIFMDAHQPPMNVTQNCFRNQIVLCLSNSNHYDIVYPKSFMKNSRFCRSLLYEMLYERVFTMSMDRVGSQVAPCSSPFRAIAECDKLRENTEKMSVTDSENLAHSAKGKEMLHSAGGQSAEATHTETGKDAGGTQPPFCAGDSCQVILSDDKLYQAHIQEVSQDTQTALVYVDELDKTSTLPLSNLQTVNKSAQDTDSQRRRQRKRREMPLVVPFGRGSLLPTRLHSRTPGRPAGRETAPRLSGQQDPVPGSQIDEEEEKRFIQDSVALIELQERDTTAFPALPNRQDTGKGPKSFWGGEASFRDANRRSSCNSDEEAPTQLSVSPPPSPLTVSPVNSSSPHMRSVPLTGGPSFPILSGMPVMPPITNKESSHFLSSANLASNAAKAPSHSSVPAPQTRPTPASKTIPKPKHGPSMITPYWDGKDPIAVKSGPAPVNLTTSAGSSGSGRWSDFVPVDTSIDSDALGCSVEKQPTEPSASDQTSLNDIAISQTPNATLTKLHEAPKCDDQAAAAGSTVAFEATVSESVEQSTVDETPHPKIDEIRRSSSHSQSSEENTLVAEDSQGPFEVPVANHGVHGLPAAPSLVPNGINGMTNSPNMPHSVQPMNAAMSHPANTLRPQFVHPLPFPQPPPLPPRMPFTVPSYPWLAVTSPHLSNMAGPINFNVMPSMDPSGSDLPHTDVNTLRFFFNLGYEYYRASMIQLSTQFPILPRPNEDGSRGAESSQPKDQSPEEKPEETKKSEGVVVYVENDEESSSSSTEEDKSENHNTSYEELTGPCHGDSGCVSDVSSNDNEHRNDPNEHHSDSSSQHSNGSITLSAEFINFCRTFCSPASSHSQNSSQSRRSPMVSSKLLKPLKDIPPRFQKMLSQNAVGKEQQFEGPPLVRQVAMSSHKNSVKNSSTSVQSSNVVEESSNQSPSTSFNPNAQSFTPSSYECSSNQSYSPVGYSQPDNGVPYSPAEEYPPPYSYYMNGTCYYPPPVMGTAPVPVPQPAPGGTQYMQCQYYMPYPQPCQAAPTTVVYSNAPPPPPVQYNHYPATPPQAQATHYTYTS